MVEMKVIWRRLMMSRRSSRHLDMAKPRIRLRTWAERTMITAAAMTLMMNTGQTAWVKWLTLNEMAVMPSGFAPTPLSICSTCGTIFTCETMNAPVRTQMITPGVMVAFLICLVKTIRF